MSTIIEHVRHRVHPTWSHGEPRLRWTECRRVFAVAHPYYDRRSIAHHEPATSRCGTCYP